MDMNRTRIDAWAYMMAWRFWQHSSLRLTEQDIPLIELAADFADYERGAAILMFRRAGWLPPVKVEGGKIEYASRLRKLGRQRRLINAD